MFMNYKAPDINKAYFITGAAGFIDFYLLKKLLDAGVDVIGVDNLSDYYAVNLKQTRLNQPNQHGEFTFINGIFREKMDIFETHKPDIVVNLAAQAGVCHSIENPDVYIQSNVIRK